MNSTEKRYLAALQNHDFQQVIEHVQAMSKLAPVRVFAVLFPLWQVEATEIREQGYAYNLLERYIGRGIAEASLHSPQALADFYGLDIDMVKNALTSLDDVGHIVRMSGPLCLTPLGIRSALEGKKYIQQEGNCTLYFDGFYSKPLPSEYYHDIQYLSRGDAVALVQSSDQTGPHFHRLYSFHAWNTQAATELALQADKTRYNVQEEVVYLIPTTVSSVYLPMCIIETEKQDDQPVPRYLVYTCAHSQHAPFFEMLVNTYPEILMPFWGEKKQKCSHLWESWLKRELEEEAGHNESIMG